MGSGQQKKNGMKRMAKEKGPNAVVLLAMTLIVLMQPALCLQCQSQPCFASQGCCGGGEQQGLPLGLAWQGRVEGSIFSPRLAAGLLLDALRENDGRRAFSSRWAREARERRQGRLRGGGGGEEEKEGGKGEGEEERSDERNGEENDGKPPTLNITCEYRDHIFLSGLPKYANEGWVATLLGHSNIAIEEDTGDIKVFVYRDESGACTGSAVVGMVSAEEAERAERECSGRVLAGAGTTIHVRIVGKKRGREEEDAVPAGFQRFTDAVTGKDYFYNTETGEVQWEKPEDVPAAQDADAPRISRQGRAVIGGQGVANKKEEEGPIGPKVPIEESTDTSEEERRKEADIERRRRNMPRGVPADILLVDRKAHEAAAKVAPVYGDEGFVHCIGKCICRCVSFADVFHWIVLAGDTRSLPHPFPLFLSLNQIMISLPVCFSVAGAETIA